ncbi:hypothetical protein Nepgr_028346 [Nepenthes gracilis]|uniref:Uncharacterized protein n=1 Tax=Nepenthes gracilis TaxID=150966 RepID=A0AAD3Y2B7_NEPGR|nr:hypothetical protein Nepgr_028346 [Nepenthes gracilis]
MCLGSGKTASCWMFCLGRQPCGVHLLVESNAGIWGGSWMMPLRWKWNHLLLQIWPFVAAFGCCSAAGCVEFWPFAAGSWIIFGCKWVLLLVFLKKENRLDRGFCFYVKVSLVLLLCYAQQPDDGASLVSEPSITVSVPCRATV